MRLVIEGTPEEVAEHLRRLAPAQLQPVLPVDMRPWLGITPPPWQPAGQGISPYPRWEWPYTVTICAAGTGVQS